VDLIETQRYLAVAGKLTRAVIIILLLAAKSVCYRTDGNNRSGAGAEPGIGSIRVR
jgi:hypothetical protein